MTQNWLREMAEERDRALLSMDPDQVVDYMLKYDIPVPDDPIALMITMHRARAISQTLPSDVRAQSRRWLSNRGLDISPEEAF